MKFIFHLFLISILKGIYFYWLTAVKKNERYEDAPTRREGGSGKSGEVGGSEIYPNRPKHFRNEISNIKAGAPLPVLSSQKTQSETEDLIRERAAAKP